MQRASTQETTNRDHRENEITLCLSRTPPSHFVPEDRRLNHLGIRRLRCDVKKKKNRRGGEVVRVSEGEDAEPVWDFSRASRVLEVHVRHVVFGT